jgi:hypothetical protein
MFEFVEESLDEVTLAIKGKIAWQSNRAAGVGRNHRGDLPIGQKFDKGVGVVCLVANQSRRTGILEQRLCADEVVGLSWSEQQLDGITQRIDERVNFGTQSSARSADRLLAVFFRAPALC